MKEFLAYAVIVCLCIAHVALAEQVVINGLALTIDERRIIDTTNLELTVGEITRIVAKEDADRFILEQYFTRPAMLQRISIDQLESFIVASASHGEEGRVRAVSAFEALPLHPLSSDAKILNFVGKNVGNENFRDVVQEVGGRSTNRFSRFARAGLVYTVGLYDPDWVGSLPTPTRADLQDLVADSIDQEFPRCFENRDLINATKLFELSRALFAGAGRRFQNHETMFLKLEQAMDTLSATNSENLNSLLAGTTGDKSVDHMVAPIVLDVLHKEARTLLAQKRPDMALSVLAGVDFRRRTQTTHALVRESLEMLSPTQYSVLDDIRLEVVLRGLSHKDEGIRTIHLRLLEARFYDLTREGKRDLADQYMNEIVHIRPDPNPHNDTLRMAIVFSELEFGTRSEAQIRFKQVRTASIRDYAALVAAGFYLNQYVIALLVAFPTAYLLFVVSARLPRRKIKTTYSAMPRGAVEPPPPPEEDFRPFVTSPSKRDVELEEYAETLRPFDLEIGASLKEIKVAYRNAVKEFHPDTNPDLPPEASELFITLTRAYDRAIEIHKRRFQRR
jgi:hypothetical protein